ncbi:ATP synthase subunit delta [Striga asiatica]|uniref:ATP synthase subunit delta n=1 Tax=Striga asiatica TaxID=4170 RepID=A0A5A7NX99_STRAF|nr:ATP synthase subunit delta [Striga asiatica]
MEVEANFEKKQITCFLRHYISDYQDRDESNYAVVVVYVNEDHIEPIMALEETNTSVHPHVLGKQVAVEEQLTPTTQKVLASILDTPSPTAPDKQKKTTAKRSLDFQLQSSSAANAGELPVDDPVQGSAIGTSEKIAIKHTSKITLLLPYKPHFRLIFTAKDLVHYPFC